LAQRTVGRLGPLEYALSALGITVTIVTVIIDPSARA
jgi:hypothetical protein